MSTTDLSIFGGKTAMPAHLMQNTADAQLGNEHGGAEDTAIPVLNLLQALSPQVADSTVDGAKAGLFHNSITDDLYPTVNVINLSFSRDYAVFRKQNRGGGYHGSFETQADAQAKVAELGGNADDYDIFETAKHVVLLLDEAGQPVQPMLIRLKSTGIQVSKTWNAAIQTEGQGAARFATVWRLEAEKKSKNGNTWYVMKPGFLGWAPEALYEEAKKFYEATKG